MALNGQWLLPDSSCLDCAGITSKFEQDFLRGPVWPYRIAKNLTGRRKKDAPTHFPITIGVTGEEFVVNAPIKNHAAPLSLLVYLPPGILVNRENDDAMHLTESFASYDKIQLKGAVDFAIEKVRLKHPFARELSFSITYDNYPVHSFGRLITKIAWGIAVGELGLVSFAENYATEIILGQSNLISRYFGCLDSTLNPIRLGKHAAGVNISNKIVSVDIQLFAESESPVYTVIVGRVKDSFTPPNSSNSHFIR